MQELVCSSRAPHWEEIQDRVSRVREQMAESDIEQLILTDQVNIEYFLGYRTLTWAYKARPLFAIISQSDVHLIAAQSEKRNLDQVRQSFETHLYDGYLTQAVQKLSSILRSAPSKTAKIAIDYGQDFFGRGSLELIDFLNKHCASNRLVSAGPVIWPVRTLKSRYELEQKKRAFSIVNRAFDDVISKATWGISEVELYAQMQCCFFEHGAETAAPIAMSFGQGDMIYNRPPSKRKLCEGDYIWTDFRATIGGYPADRNRIARAGTPEDWEISTYTRVRNVTIDLARSIRPGERTGDIFNRYLEMWADQDLPAPYKYLNRIGHGGGRDVTEPPSISRGGTDVIEAGMIIHLEPKLELKNAVFQFEEVIHVSDGRNEFLSDLSPENLPTIPKDQ
ncbi:M24 family metallopeptidase [Labrenzia sp. DG1229]|uniref:M24 family metallopeptidase n=1 Tax=Labrenzia sp. DG1229 TaxID=681847 RepID=UPI0005679C8F|nr:M24 family metallopeptidase [Labrenzia sp. DG1229]